MTTARPRQAAPAQGSPRTVFAVLPPGVSAPHGLHCAGQLDRFDFAVPIAARMGVDVLLVSQKLVDAADGWDALRNLGTQGTPSPEIWVIADGEPASAKRFQGIASRILGPAAGAAGPECQVPQPLSVGTHAAQTLALVMGSKGGVGKTLVTANLASKLAALGHKVAAIDLDFESGDLSLRLGLTPSLDLIGASNMLGHPPWDQWMTSSRSLPLRLWAAPARPELAALANEALVRGLVQWARRESAFVVVDTPADADNELLYAILEDSSRVILVTTLCPGAVRQAKVTVELLKRLNYPVRERFSLAINRVGRRNPLSIRDVSDLVGCEPCAVLPEAGYRADLEAYRGRATVLAYPRSRLARSIGELVSFLWPETARHTPRILPGLWGGPVRGPRGQRAFWRRD